MGYVPTCLAVLAIALTGVQTGAADTANRGPLALRVQMLRLAEVDWRLRLAATPRCPRAASGIGVTIDHAAAYRPADRALLARTLQMGEMPQIAAVAPDSPADRAGLRSGDELLAIGDVRVAETLAQTADPALFAEDVMDRLADLPEGRPVSLVVRRGRASLRKSVVPVAICASRTMLETRGSLEAHSDSHDIAVTSALVDFTANDDELALILGHELAHVILEAAVDAPPAESLAAEQQADLLGAAIAHCAGYDMARAAAFWPRFEAQDALKRERLATHPSPGQREARIRSAATGFTCPIDNWPIHAPSDTGFHR